MPDLLLELFCEEIPARMQAKAAEDLKSKVTNSLVDLGLVYEGAIAHVTPRRLALHIAGLPARSKDVREEKKGPRVGAPDAAIAGFLKSAGLSSIDQAQKQSDGKKGEFYVATVTRQGRDTKDILAEIITKTVRDFPWPKSMRWGPASRETNSLRWVRPLHSILCTFGSDTETPEIVEFEIDGLAASDVTYGHRFLSPMPCQARRFDDYVSTLERGRVVLERERRKDIILHEAKTLAFAQGFELVEDQGLLEEVCGLVEWPVVLMGTFDESFLTVPDAVIRTTIRNNQKCFVLRNTTPSRAASQRDLPPQGGGENTAFSFSPSPRGGGSANEMSRGGVESQLANKFILVANIAASDGGKEIIKGNERVVAARLSDAKFFYEQDQKQKLLDRAKKLDSITFHEKLGTQGERVQRIAVLARDIAPLVGADPKKAEETARLAKADLVTEMVGEFPELQGYMGRRYAELEGFESDICAAIEEHYKPLGPSDTVPSNPISIAVALADKLDMLVGFWAIDEKPTGSKDPFALRRAALGVIRLVLQNDIKTNLRYFCEKHFPRFGFKDYLEYASKADSLLGFCNDRIEQQAKDEGLRHDVVQAVMENLSVITGESPTTIFKRVKALDAILKTENGAALQAGVTRALNILRIEEKKDNTSYDGKATSTLTAAEEIALSKAIDAAETAVAAALQKEDFTAAMTSIAQLRAPIDAFFDKVIVNSDDPQERASRLALLARIRKATSRIADFSKLEG